MVSNLEQPFGENGVKLGYSTKVIMLLRDYFSRVAFSTDERTSPKNNPYGPEAYHSGEDHLVNGLRERMYREFRRYGVLKYWGLNITQWMNTPYEECQLMIAICKEEQEEERKMSANVSRKEEAIQKELATITKQNKQK